MFMPQKMEVLNPYGEYGARFRKLMPPDIPKEFYKSYGNTWVDLVNAWFFSGLPKETEFIPVEGIDGNDALRHIKSIMKSWEPQHEDKTAACAYLLSIWFKEINIPEKSTQEGSENNGKKN